MSILIRHSNIRIFNKSVVKHLYPTMVSRVSSPLYSPIIYSYDHEDKQNTSYENNITKNKHWPIKTINVPIINYIHIPYF